MMRAETQFNPLAKLQTFLAQRDPLESAIAAAPDHPELRLFRLSIQWSVPFFLDYAATWTKTPARSRRIGRRLLGNEPNRALCLNFPTTPQR